MIREDQMFVADVVVIDSMGETVASNAINWPASAVVKLSAIINIHKYRALHEGHHFISMAMEVHGTHRCDMDCFITECARFIAR
jgi:hypothetical protein